MTNAQALTRPSVSRLESLTSLRFFAALMVAIHHTRTIWAHSAFTDFLGQIGWLGVTFFFVLSGFVLMWGYDPTVTFKRFITRRLIRIYPLHVVTLCLALLAMVTIHNPMAGYVGTPIGTVLNFLLIHDWVPLHPNIRQAWNGVSWTLSCELFFYLCAPFLFPLLAKYYRACRIILPAMWLALMGLAVFATLRQMGDLLDIMVYFPVPRVVEFCLGALAAIALKQNPLSVGKLPGLALMTLPILIYCYFVPESGGYRNGATMVQLIVPGALLLIFATAHADQRGRSGWLQNPVLVFLGEASFALYMIHALFLGIFCWLMGRLFPQMLQAVMPGEVMRVIYLTYATILSAAVYWFFEHPIRLWLLRITSGQQQPRLRADDPVEIGPLAAQSPPHPLVPPYLAK
jgi:peptidoglycan/LPS O-acetylase OafA/YrhL